MMNNENGRSMVEMLGVLAIIGVLSVGGIAGYTMAMNKYKANEILNTASMMAVLSRSANGGLGNNIASLGAAGLNPPVAGVNMAATYSAGSVAIAVTNVNSTAICNAVTAGASTDGANLYTITCS